MMPRRAGRFLAVAAAMAAAVPAELAAQPSLSLPEAVVAAFADTCLVEDPLAFDDAVTAAGLAGWIDAEPEAHPELRTLLDVVEAAMVSPGEAARTALFQRETAYHNSFLVLTRQPTEAGVIIACLLYDFDGTNPIPASLLERLLGPPSMVNNDRPDWILSERWQAPAAYPALLEVVSSYIPDGSPMVELGGFSGTAVAARWISP